MRNTTHPSNRRHSVRHHSSVEMQSVLLLMPKAFIVHSSSEPLPSLRPILRSPLSLVPKVTMALLLALLFIHRMLVFALLLIMP